LQRINEENAELHGKIANDKEKSLGNPI